MNTDSQKGGASDLFDGWTQLLIDNHKKLQYGSVSASPPSTLYHYTSLDGLLAILESNVVWATHINFTNDEDELKYGKSLVCEELKEIPGASELIDFDELEYLWHKFEPYIFSLASDKSDSGQWKNYGADGFGAAICMDTSHLDTSFSGNNRMALLRVLYDEEKQKRQIRGVIDWFLRQYKYTLRGFEYDEDEFKSLIIGALLILCLNFKSSSHDRESEYRIVYYRMKDDPLGDRKIDDQRFDVKFRCRNGTVGQYSDYILPYVDIPIDRHIPISGIILGSKLDLDSNEQALLMYDPSLKDAISQSETRIRF